MCYIKELRLAQNMSQSELASLIGVSQQAVASWESGRKFPRISQLFAIADIFGCTIDALLNRTCEEGS